MRRLKIGFLIGLAFATGLIGTAIADLNYTQGSGTVLFDFLCFSTKHCSAHVNVNSAGTEIGTAGAPIRTDPTGTTTQPVSAASLPLPTGGATAANQATEITSLGTIAANSGTQATAANQATGNASLATIATNSGTQATAANQATGNASLATIATNTGAPLPACSTTPCTLTAANVGADPSSGKGTPTQAFLALPATTTTQIVALNGTKVTYVTLAKVIAGGTVNVTFKFGTGTNCGTGTTTLEGPYPLTAQSGWVEGNGAGPVMIVPSGQALCVTTDASVSGGVKLIFQQI